MWQTMCVFSWSIWSCTFLHVNVVIIICLKYCKLYCHVYSNFTLKKQQKKLMFYYFLCYVMRCWLSTVLQQYRFISNIPFVLYPDYASYVHYVKVAKTNGKHWFLVWVGLSHNVQNREVTKHCPNKGGYSVSNAVKTFHQTVLFMCNVCKPVHI